ncbi:HlyD family efflux transporter periplasmic adaptor subunit [Tissierella sp.]|uniref:HlyD family efflux transporter periplasmic adaptor subunit n=1 Tax=Tissierella sp. TaxID=41274 RepID=UPI00285C41A3|nr:HlyD family efflux transporter periplasmic adaptor subunit [Tissierella sp.]MDR7856409.1 HlyD family efflux transporter periplasmic adaptor subunit [Tissierella sp.]
MSYSKREKNRKKRKIYQAIIVSFVFICLIFRSVPSLLANNAKTVLPEKETLIKKITAQGYIIMNEVVIKSTSNGSIEYLVNEGERVAAGIEVANINSLNDTSSLKQELVQVEESILALKKSESETKLLINETTKVEDLKTNLITQLQEMISSGKYEEIYLLKEQLALYEDKVKDISFSDTLLGKSLGGLEDKRDKLKEEISSNHIRYYTSAGGIISYNVDGFENIFLPKDFENYSYDKLREFKKTDKKYLSTNISVGDSIYKIIDNFQWYIAVRVEDIEEIKDFSLNNTVRVSRKGDKQEIKGKIVAINTSDSKAVMVIKFTDKLHDYYNTRFPEIEIIKYKVDGLKIPTKAIIDKDSIRGVYIKDKSGIVKFRPVKILGEEGNNTYVDLGDNNANILLEGTEKSVQTITLFDEIFTNTINIKEGQITN